MRDSGAEAPGASTLGAAGGAHPLSRALAALALALPAALATAQLTTDQVPLRRTIPEEDQVRGEIEHNLFQLGPVRVLPWFSLNNFGYNNNITGSSTNPVGDWTASVGAGARFYLPFGRKTFLRLDALPQYTWYKDSSDRNEWGGRGEVAYLGFFNHLSFRVSGAYLVDASSVLTSEVPALVLRKGWDAKAQFEIDLAHRVSMFAGAEFLRERLSDPSGDLTGHVDVANYNRTDGAARAGFRFTFSPGFSVSMAAEGTQTEFVQTAQLRDNRSYAPLVGLHYDRPRLFVNLFAGYRFGRSFNGSSFPEFETPTGSAFVAYTLIRALDIQAFWSRRLAYGSSAAVPYYLEGRWGGGFAARPFSKVSVGAYGSYGTDDYGLSTRGSGGAAARLDKIVSFGGSLTIGLWRNIALTAQASDTRYDSNTAGNDRSVFTFLTGLSFGLEFAR